MTLKRTACAIMTMCAFLAFAEEADFFESDRYRGFTGTIDWLMGTRPDSRVAIGSTLCDIEDLIVDGVPKWISCDEELSEYFETDEILYYEQLSAIITQAIYNNLGRVYDSVFPSVMASEDGNTVQISIGIECAKNILLPVKIMTEEREVEIQLNNPCTVELSIGMIIEVDSGKVLDWGSGQGISVFLDYYTMTLRSFDEMRSFEAPVLYYGEFQYPLLTEFNLDVTESWFLCGDGERQILVSSDEDEEPANQYFSYEQLADGEYFWESNVSGSASMKLTIDDEITGETILSFSYASEDLVENMDPCVGVDDGGEFSVSAVRMDE